MVDEADWLFWRLVTQVPKVAIHFAAIAAFLNFIIPGFGTIFAACMDEGLTVSKTQIVIGVAQFLTSFLIIGWILSLYWGYLIVMRSLNVNMGANSRSQ